MAQQPGSTPKQKGDDDDAVPARPPTPPGPHAPSTQQGKILFLYAWRTTDHEALKDQLTMLQGSDSFEVKSIVNMSREDVLASFTAQEYSRVIINTHGSGDLSLRTGESTIIDAQKLDEDGYDFLAELTARGVKHVMLLTCHGGQWRGVNSLAHPERHVIDTQFRLLFSTFKKIIRQLLQTPNDWGFLASVKCQSGTDYLEGAYAAAVKERAEQDAETAAALRKEPAQQAFRDLKPGEWD